MRTRVVAGDHQPLAVVGDPRKRSDGFGQGDCVDRSRRSPCRDWPIRRVPSGRPEWQKIRQAPGRPLAVAPTSYRRGGDQSSAGLYRPDPPGGRRYSATPPGRRFPAGTGRLLPANDIVDPSPVCGIVCVSSPLVRKAIPPQPEVDVAFVVHGQGRKQDLAFEVGRFRLTTWSKLPDWSKTWIEPVRESIA